MYLYIITLHSGAKPESAPPKEPQARDIDFGESEYLKAISSQDPRGFLPLGQATQSSQNETKTLAARLWYSKEFIGKTDLEKILKDAYTFGFGRYAYLEAPNTDTLRQESKCGRRFEVNNFEFQFCATRIKLSDEMGKNARDELLHFWDASGAKYSLKPKYEPCSTPTDAIEIPYIVPPKEFRTLEDIGRFSDYVESLTEIETKKAAWLGGICSEDTIVGKESEFGYACPTEAFEEHAMFFSANRKKNLELAAERKKDRILVLKQKGSSEVIQKALMPCDMTPWFGTDLLPEFEVVKAVDWVPGVGCLDEATLKALTEALKPAPTASAPSTLVKDTNTIRDPPIFHNGVRVDLATAAATPQFPHQEDLDVLWDVFTREYIQRPKRADGLDHVRIPNSILLAVWKLLALQPKSALLYGNPKYENSIIRKKDLPKNWSKVITPEVLTDYFYAKDEKFQGCILYTFYNRGFLQTLLDFYDMKMTANDNINWLAFPAIDPNPIVLALTNPAGLTDDHKKAWVAKFVRERMEKKERAVAGSQETYSDFLCWVRSGLFLGMSINCSSQYSSDFLAQFPQAEFTRLMKESGLTMTRRSRGMVFVGATLRSKADDDWTMETERVPAEGETLPLGSEMTGPTGTSETAEMLSGFDTTEENWATPS